MKQVVQDQGEGLVQVVEIPSPQLRDEGILVRVEASVISSGTERSKIQMGEKSLVAKAKARPDLVKKVIDQAKKDGLADTVALVRDRLGTPQPLGYSAAGVVLEVGAKAPGFQPGQRVAIGGAGYANHAEVDYVPANLAVPVPEGVNTADAAFATIGSIALHGIRQATLTAGESVVVVGLGLVGQLTVRLLLAYGHPVTGVDPSPAARADAEALGVVAVDPGDPQLETMAADAVLLTAATSSSELINSAAGWCRDRGRVIVVGDVGLGLQRGPFYDAEIDVRLSRSYGPGRYDPAYEEHGHDYPIGYVRWTEQRNMAEILRLIASGALVVADLVTAEHEIDEAVAAYDSLKGPDRVRALVLTYPQRDLTAGPIRLTGGAVSGARNDSRASVRVGVCGAGNFARKTLLPALERTGKVQYSAISTATGITARHVGEHKGFAVVMPDPEDVCADPHTDAVLIATRHDTHAHLAGLAATAGKTVFVEKPLAVTAAEVDALAAADGAWRIVTGYNRRYAPATLDVRAAVARRNGPVNLDIRVNAGRLPAGHWADDPAQGGRIIGEGCHFVDLACWLVGAAASTVFAVGSGRRSPEVEDNVQMVLGWDDGSAATISYLTEGASSLPKERVEVAGGGRTYLIDDFRTWTVFGGGGSQDRGGRKQDKGHKELIKRWVDFAAGAAESPVPFEQAAEVTRLSLAVVESLRTGASVRLPGYTW